MRTKKLNRVFEFLILAAALTFIAYTLQTLWLHGRHRPESRVELKDFIGQIQLGDSQLKIQNLFTKTNYHQLQLKIGLPANRWLVTTPHEWGAGNWYLHLEFDGKNELAASRVRTMDSVREKPHDAALPDKVTPSWKKAFP